MAAEPGRVEDTKAWLTKANLDLEAGNHDMKGIPPLLADAAFHSQQAAEKAMKAFLAWHDIPSRKTHNLDEVGKACSGIDLSLKTVLDRAVPLTEFAWKYRYPGEPGEPTREEVEAALKVARDVYESVLQRLPAETRPA